MIGSWSSFGTLRYCKLSWITFTLFIILYHGLPILPMVHFAAENESFACRWRPGGSMRWTEIQPDMESVQHTATTCCALLCNDVSYFFYCNSLAKFGQSGWKFYCCIAWIAWMSPLALLSESPQQNSAKAAGISRDPPQILIHNSFVWGAREDSWKPKLMRT